LADSGKWVTPIASERADTQSTIKFRSSNKTVILQMGTSAPVMVDNKWSMGAAQPVVLQGKSLETGGGLAAAPGAGKFAFEKNVQGLKPGTRYYALITVPTGNGYFPVQASTAVTTTLLANDHTETGDVWADHYFYASRAKVDFRIGSSNNNAANKSATTLTGTKVSTGNQPPKYRFVRSLSGLKPSTQYFTKLSFPASGNQLADEQYGNFWTKERNVSVTVSSIHVSDDADGAFRGAGDLAFYIRSLGSNDPQSNAQWSAKSDNVSMKSGSTKTGFGRNLTQSKSFKSSNTAWIFVQGVEDDTLPTTRKACHLNDYFGNKSEAQQFSKSLCHDSSYAVGSATLPTKKYTGTHRQTVKIQVFRSPALIFDVEVLVETSAK